MNMFGTDILGGPIFLGPFFGTYFLGPNSWDLFWGTNFQGSIFWDQFSGTNFRAPIFVDQFSGTYFRGPIFRDQFLGKIHGKFVSLLIRYMNLSSLDKKKVRLLFFNISKVVTLWSI